SQSSRSRRPSSATSRNSSPTTTPQQTDYPRPNVAPKLKKSGSDMNLTETIIPNSAQVNAEDLIASPRTVTITQVEACATEQPVFVHLAEFPGRTYRPSKSMRRLMVSAWGAEAAGYTGRKLTLYRNPDIRFGKEVVGGIEISHMSHIDKPLTVALTVSRGKRKNFT